jgi:outer membrane autotransporter protein
MSLALIGASPGTGWAANLWVTNLDDSGVGSLRTAIASAADGDTIIFNSSLSGTITLASDLSALNSVTLKGGDGVTLVRSGSSTIKTLTVATGKTLAGDLAMDVQAKNLSGNRAFGLSGVNGLKISTLSGSVSATGNIPTYGLYTLGPVAITTLSGKVSATTSGENANGIYSDIDMSLTSLSGSVSATASTNEAYGLYSVANMTMNELSGSVSATAGGYKAYGLNSVADINVSNLSGAVSATAGTYNAGGLYSVADMTIKDLSGTVSATAGGHGAYGLNSGGDISVSNLSGTVSATAGTYHANGLFSVADMTMNDLSGTVSATTGTFGALGIHSFGSLKNSAGGATDISGSVTAKANGLAVAVSANSGMNLYVTGTLNAKDTSNSGKAYAIAAGTANGKNWTTGGNYADTVILGRGASVTGAIDLGLGTNLLTLEDAGTLLGNVSNITTLTKSGSGTWNTTGNIRTGDLKVDDGTLLVNVTQSGTPTVVATGTVTNNGVIKFNLDGTITSSSFPVLSSGVGLAGTGTYTTNSVFLTAAINNKNVDLNKRTFSDVFSGTNSNWTKLASSLDANYATASDDLSSLISNLEQSSTQAEADAAMDQLSSLLLTQSMDMSVGASQLQSSTTQMRMADMRSHQIYLAQKERNDRDDPDTWPQVAAIGDLSGMLHRSPENDPNGLYMRGMGRTGSIDSHGGYNGYDYNSGLISGGYDRVVQDNFLLGVSLGYSTTGAKYKDAGGSTSTLNSSTLGLYGSWFEDAWYVDTILSGTYNTYDTKRELPSLGLTAKADSTGHTLSAKTEGGYRFDFNGYGLTPRTSLEYTRFHQEGYTESGAGAANMIINDTNANFLESGLGAKVDHIWEADFGQIIPEASAMWMHEWMTQDRQITYSMTGMPGTMFSQTTAESSNDSLQLGAGVRFLLEDGPILTARYQGELQQYARSHSIMLESLWVF